MGVEFNVWQSHVVGLTQPSLLNVRFTLSTVVSVSVCEREWVCKMVEHLESFAASPTFPQWSLNRENDMFSQQGYSCYILIAKLTPEQYLERASPHMWRESISCSYTSGIVKIEKSCQLVLCKSFLWFQCLWWSDCSQTFGKAEDAQIGLCLHHYHHHQWLLLCHLVYRTQTGLAPAV